MLKYLNDKFQISNKKKLKFFDKKVKKTCMKFKV